MDAKTAAKAIEIVNKLNEYQRVLDYLLQIQRGDRTTSIILRNWHGGKDPIEAELITLKGINLNAMIDFFIQEINKIKKELEDL